MKMVRPRPDIEEDQRPEMDDGKPVTIDRPFRLLGHEIIHHGQETGGQEETDRIMPVPLLGQRVLHTREGAVALGTEPAPRSEEHTSELQSLMRNSYAVFCLKKKQKKRNKNQLSRHKQTYNIRDTDIK